MGDRSSRTSKGTLKRTAFVRPVLTVDGRVVAVGTSATSYEDDVVSRVALTLNPTPVDGATGVRSAASTPRSARGQPLEPSSSLGGVEGEHG